MLLILYNIERQINQLIDGEPRNVNDYLYRRLGLWNWYEKAKKNLQQRESHMLLIMMIKKPFWKSRRRCPIFIFIHLISRNGCSLPFLPDWEVSVRDIFLPWIWAGTGGSHGKMSVKITADTVHPLAAKQRSWCYRIRFMKQQSGM